ncbi:hypothetical protein OG589_24570 [Sphaerisporangium sp. NBC_01403]|uniref:hypothetical protein n=1 Tax=Sphaerisporangium sp. NBC_01403 TaxID=2903599 RepID=UPI00324E4C0B
MAEDDLHYRPSTQELGWLKGLRPQSCLVVGEPAPGSRDALKALAPDVRNIRNNPKTRGLHRGTYAVLSEGTWHAIVVFVAQASGSAESARRRYLEDGHLLDAWAVQQQKWEGAPRLAGDPRFSIGDMVQPDVPLGDRCHDAHPNA